MKTWLIALSFVFAASAAIAADDVVTTAPAETTAVLPAEVDPAAAPVDAAEKVKESK